MNIIGGSASTALARQVSEITGDKFIPVERKRFPDGELYLRMQQSVAEDPVTIVQTTYPDEHIIELFFLIDAAHRAEADTITLFIPYFGYARQDKQFKTGEPVSAEALAVLLSHHTDQIITIDPHKEHIIDFFTTPAESISAVSSIADYLKDKNIDFVLAPDKGALDRANRCADLLHCDVDYLEKTRIDGSTIKITPKQLKANGKTVAIIDDIISTGGTMATSIHELTKQGAQHVYVACTHGLFAGNAIQKLTSAGCEEIIATDTIQSSYSKVSTANLIAKTIQKLPS